MGEMTWVLMVVTWLALSVGFVLGCRWAALCRRWDAERPILKSDTAPGKLRADWDVVSRGGRIRTGDFLLPKQARYRTAPRPVAKI